MKTVKDFGVFVQLEGFRKQGLVHISQLSNERVEPEDIPGIVEVGDSVWVKVIGISVRPPLHLIHSPIQGREEERFNIEERRNSSLFLDSLLRFSSSLLYSLWSHQGLYG